tara:strand:+ start:5518 stop:6657 length:1140 start_codon:yes stop_codon:yes gene_type:complete
MIPLSVPNISSEELENVKNCIETGWISSAGSYVDEFEEKFSEYLGIHDSVSTVNGTAALHLSLKILGVKKNDLVIMPNVTFVASANAISYLGANPILIDISEDDWQMDISLLDHFLSKQCQKNKDGDLIHLKSSRRISALMIVHVQGNICDMDKLLYICNKYNLPVLEDAAEALGSSFKNNFAGTMGHMGCFSFNGNKIISTGGGGMIVSSNPDFIKKAKHLSTTAKVDSLTYYHDDIGYNYRLVNILAAIGLAQLEKLDTFKEKKIQIASRYRENLTGIGDIGFQKIKSDVISNEWLFTITTKSMQKLLSYLNSNNVMSRPFWIPMNELPMYSECLYISSKNISSYVHQRALSIPCSTGITDDQMGEVIEKVKLFFNS